MLQPECDVSVSKLIGFETFQFFDGLDSISRKFGIKKYWIQFRKKLVLKKVSDSVSKKIVIGKSFRFSLVQIWSILGDVSVSKLLSFKTF